MFPRSRLFWAVSLGHLTNDTFMSMGPVLLAFISASILPLRVTEIGVILGVTALLGAVTQPFFGWLADQGSGRLLGAGGVAWTVGWMLVGIAAAGRGLAWLMVPAFIIPALGSGAFHPVGSMWAASEKGRAASSLSYFFLMGQLGLGLGPALAGLLLSSAGGGSLFAQALGPAFGARLIERGTVAPVLATGLLALPVIALMAFTIPSRRAHRAARAAAPAPAARTIIPARTLALLVLMVALRSLAQPGSVNFIPVLFQARGWSPAEYGLITSSFWLAAGLAGVGFGLLADRFDRRRVIAASLLLSAPTFFLLPTATGAAAFGLAIAAGAFSGGSHSIIVVMAQGLLPGSKGLASGAILGLIFGMGAVGNFLIGAASQAIGLDATFQLVAGAIAAAGALALALPAAHPQPPPLPAEVETAPAAV